MEQILSDILLRESQMQFYIFIKSYFLQVLESLTNTNLLFHNQKNL